MKCSPVSVNKMETGSQRSAEKNGRGKSKNYSRFIYKVVKQGPQERSVFLSRDPDLIFSVASEAARLSLYNKSRTITRREVESAVQNMAAPGRSSLSAATE